VERTRRLPLFFISFIIGGAPLGVAFGNNHISHPVFHGE
jgi:hypothetical protein